MSDNTKFSGRRPFYKRQLMVDRKFQYRLVGTLLAVWAANAFFFVLVQYFLYLGHLEAFYELSPRAGMLPLLSFEALVRSSVLFTSLFGAIVLFVVASYLSNQIAGPLWRAKNSLSQLATGDWNVELRFRENDFLQDYPETFNSLVGSLRKNAEEDIHEIELLTAAAGDQQEIRVGLDRLRARIEQRLRSESSLESEVTAPQDVAPVHAG